MSWPPHLVVGGLLLHERQRPADLDASLLYVGERVDSLATGCGLQLRLRLDAEPLGEAASWLEHYRGFWSERLEALEAFLLESQPAGGRNPPTEPPP